jgi:hypothetical protein
MFSKRAKKIKTSKDNSTLTIDVNDAILIRDKLERMSEGAVISKEDAQVLQVASRLIDMLVNIYGMWANSKKKIAKLLRIVNGQALQWPIWLKTA